MGGWHEVSFWPLSKTCILLCHKKLLVFYYQVLSLKAISVSARNISSLTEKKTAVDALHKMNNVKHGRTISPATSLFNLSRLLQPLRFKKGRQTTNSFFE